MTILDDLKTTTEYPLGVNSLLSVLIKRGLNGDDTQTTAIANSNEFKGAKADYLIKLACSPDVSEGGVSISQSNKSDFIIIANTLYREIGEPSYAVSQPVVKVEYE